MGIYYSDEILERQLEGISKASYLKDRKSLLTDMIVHLPQVCLASQNQLSSINNRVKHLSLTTYDD